jgi:hypothetical protein
MWRRSSTDAELAAIEAVYRGRFRSFVRLATAITGSEQAALDAVHDGFVRSPAPEPAAEPGIGSGLDPPHRLERGAEVPHG